MSKLSSLLPTRARRTVYRRVIYPLISLTVILGLWLGQPLTAQAIPWLELILRGAQIIQLSNMSDRQEVALGKQINQQIAQQVPLSNNRALTRYLDNLGQRLASQSSRPNIPYTFQVVNDDKINAFATMGGFVYINRGLMLAADNEAQLASVVGHEIGHVAARHAVDQMKQMAIAGGIAAATGLDRNKAVAIGVELALRRPNSRNDEFEADQLGLDMLMKSGYAPSAMPEFMKKLLGGGSPPTFLSTHPATRDRIVRLNQAIPASRANVGGGLDNQAYQARLRSLM